MKRFLLAALLFCSTNPVAATPAAPVQYRVRFHEAAGVTVAADGVGARIVRASDTNAVLELTPEGAAALESNPAVASIEACPGACVTAIADAVELRTWSTGTYQYDGVGNIWAMGEDRYAYDYVSRLASATVKNVGPNVEQSFAYDAFGNIVTITTNGDAVSQPVNSATNRRTDWTYDARGNATVTASDGFAYAYDALNMQTGITKGGGRHRSFVYTADDERIGVIESTKATVWRLRGLDKKVLREYTESVPDANGKTVLQWSQDFLHRGGQLVATEKRNEFRYYHLDHLGSTRLVTNELGQEVSRYDYYPFGEDARPLNERGVGDALQYTGHERDMLEPGETGDARGFDYMHARYYSAGVGRFLSADPYLDVKKAMKNPQNWNRYAYVSNNPLKRLDPDGRSEVDVVYKLVQFIYDGKKIIGFKTLGTLTREQAVLARQAGKSVQVSAKTEKKAYRLANDLETAAYPSSPNIHHGRDAHKMSGNQAHVQSDGEAGHSYYRTFANQPLRSAATIAGALILPFKVDLALALLEYGLGLAAEAGIQKIDEVRETNPAGGEARGERAADNIINE